MGILGNEKADAAAKSALSLPVTRMKLPATGMYPRVTKLIFDEWQEVWNCCAGNKLHAISNTVGYYKQKTCLSRRDTVLLNRLRIGHTRVRGPKPPNSINFTISFTYFIVTHRNAR